MFIPRESEGLEYRKIRACGLVSNVSTEWARRPMQDAIHEDDRPFHWRPCERSLCGALGQLPEEAGGEGGLVARRADYRARREIRTDPLCRAARRRSARRCLRPRPSPIHA